MMNSLKMKKVKLKWLKKRKIKQNLVKLPRENEEKNLFFCWLCGLTNLYSRKKLYTQKCTYFAPKPIFILTTFI